MDRPALVLIGDDDHADSQGPDTWPLARRVLAWARFVIVHGAGGQPLHYECGVAFACLHGRLLFIECTSRNLEAWDRAARRWTQGGGGLLIQTPPGLGHPLTPSREHVH